MICSRPTQTEIFFGIGYFSHEKEKRDKKWFFVNEFTVSAGEALALALRELAHAKIVGRTTAGGLTEMSFVPLAEGYAMTIPTGVVLGPVTVEVPSGFAIKPDLEVPNPSIDELLSGRDRQLAAARELLIAGPAWR